MSVVPFAEKRKTAVNPLRLTLFAMFLSAVSLSAPRVGTATFNIRVAESLFRRAAGEGREAVIAAIFWLKARARWTDSQVHDVSGGNGQPIRISAADADL